MVTPAQPEPRTGKYIARDLKRFMPFLIEFDNGLRGWYAGCHVEVIRPAKERVH